MRSLAFGERAPAGLDERVRDMAAGYARQVSRPRLRAGRRFVPRPEDGSTSTSAHPLGHEFRRPRAPPRISAGRFSVSLPARTHHEHCPHADPDHRSGFVPATY